ncbi:MAG: MBL fold metallo-hydrolase [Acidobacteriota bacterium]
MNESHENAQERTPRSESGPGQQRLSRRDFFRETSATVATAAVAGGLTAEGASGLGAQQETREAARGPRVRELDPEAGLSAILLGTGTPLPNPARACTSTLVLAGDRSILVDTGRGALDNLATAGFQDVSMVLFTHYHSDHIGDFGEIMVNRGIWGAERPMPVFGPQGAQQVVGSLLGAYELDTGYRKAHHGEKWSDHAMKAAIEVVEPGVIYDEDGLRIEMFAVDHTPVTPAMGFRFDYKGKSLVISGDTKYVPWMAEKAEDCDLLIHEALNTTMTQMTLGALRDNPRLTEMTREMMDYHTPTEQVARIARDAGVKRLVLNHMVPSIPPTEQAEGAFARGMGDVFGNEVIVGRDGMEFEL